jgi:sulfur-oxidizing protein SoxX
MQRRTLKKTKLFLAVLTALLGATIAASAQGVCKKKEAGYFKLVMTAPAALLKSPGIESPVAPVLGDRSRGLQIAADPEKGACLSCHNIPPLASEPNHGNLGPSLEGVGARYTEAQLRQIIVNPQAVFPGTIMPAYYHTDAWTRVGAAYVGKPILKDQDVEDLVAFLKTMR